MDRKLANNLLAGTLLSMYDTVESTVQFCLQKPNVHNRTLSKNTYEVSLTYRSMVFTQSMLITIYILPSCITTLSFSLQWRTCVEGCLTRPFKVSLFYGHRIQAPPVLIPIEQRQGAFLTFLHYWKNKEIAFLNCNFFLKMINAFSFL